MALEIPNVVAAAGIALITLESIVGAGPVIRTYGIELTSSSNLSGVEFLNAQTSDDSNVPPAQLWRLHNAVNPNQATWNVNGSLGTVENITPGPVPTPTGVPEFDALELGEVLVGYDGIVADPDVQGTTSVVWLCCWETPVSGEVA